MTAFDQWFECEYDCGPDDEVDGLRDLLREAWRACEIWHAAQGSTPLGSQPGEPQAPVTAGESPAE